MSLSATRRYVLTAARSLASQPAERLSRDAQNILFKNLLSPTVSAVAFWACGYTFAYGNDCEDTVSNGFIGTECYWGLAEGQWVEVGVGENETATLLSIEQLLAGAVDRTIVGVPWVEPKFYAMWFFQWAFCATASTIVSGAVAERIFLSVYMIITVGSAAATARHLSPPHHHLRALHVAPLR